MKNKLLALSVALSIFGYAPICSAATLVVGDGGTHAVGELFTIPVYISTSDGEYLNTVEANARFPVDKLQAISIRDSGLTDVWLEKPSYSNTAGTISFLGVIYNPGFTGENAKVLSVTFKALQAGNASVSFDKASILANDGQGTEILTASNGTTIHITPAQLNTQPAPVSNASSTSALTTKSTSTESSILLNVSAQPAPQSPQSKNASDFIDWLIIPILGVFVIAVLLLLVLYGWHRMHRTRLRILRHIASTDTALYTELFEIHKSLEDEIVRLASESKARELTQEETRILRRLSHLVEKTEHILVSELSR
jgi:hypothetical protein